MGQREREGKKQGKKRKGGKEGEKARVGREVRVGMEGRGRKSREEMRLRVLLLRKREGGEGIRKRRKEGRGGEKICRTNVKLLPTRLDFQNVIVIYELARRTDGVDFDFADVHLIVDERKVQNDELEVESTLEDVRAVDGYRASGRDWTRILTTQRIAPHDGCRRVRVGPGKTNDEIVRSVSYKVQTTTNVNYRLHAGMR